MISINAFTLLENVDSDFKKKRAMIRKISECYSGITKIYTFIRFKIIPLRFLEEILQHLPAEGTVLDLGCGFGLFSTYIAANRPLLHVIGLDLNPKRLNMGRSVARRLELSNVEYVQQDLRYWRPKGKFVAVYAIDVFHHIPMEAGNELLQAIFDNLECKGKLLLKDIDTYPRYMLLFTYILDLIMSPNDKLCYRSLNVWLAELKQCGFAHIYFHYLWDILPYPHILLVSTKES